MIVNFKDRATEDVYHGADTKAARSIPKNIWPIARRKLDLLNRARTLADLTVPPGNDFMKYRSGYKIRVNDQYRLTFKFENGNATDVLISDTH